MLAKSMSLIQSDVNRVVVGLGATGLSTMRYLSRCGLPFMAVDTRESVHELESIKKEFEGVEIVLGSAANKFIDGADELYVSPGLPLDLPVIATARVRGCRIGGDLDLFTSEVEQPVIAITGTNGKSTVTSLVGEFAAESGLLTAVAGNIGNPMLDSINDENDCYVLELSSFQLERSENFSADVACVLNVSEDHIDHHGSLLSYQQAKQRIYRRARIAVYNRDDGLTQPLDRQGLKKISFGSRTLSPEDYGLQDIDGKEFIVKGAEPVLASDSIRLKGRHNVFNVMAAIAIGEAAGLPMDTMIHVAQTFSGLAHRCRPVAEHHGVVFIDDSKATNVGATVAAVQGLKGQLKGKLTLIAGGISKDADFSALRKAFLDVDFNLILIGRDADKIEQAFSGVQTGKCSVVKASSMQDAVDLALRHSSGGDIVLLSPACASFDMFEDYRDRGNAFIKALQVRGLSAGIKEES